MKLLNAPAAMVVTESGIVIATAARESGPSESFVNSPEIGGILDCAVLSLRYDVPPEIRYDRDTPYRLDWRCCR